MADAETVPIDPNLTVNATVAMEKPSREAPTLETPLTSQPPSEALSTQPTTPSSEITPKINATSRPSIPLVPIVPAVPNLPLALRPSKRASLSAASDLVNGAPSNADHLANAVEIAAKVNAQESEDSVKSVETVTSPLVQAAPKSWADLVRTMGQNTAAKVAQIPSDPAAQTNTFPPSRAGSLADALGSYSVKDSNKKAKMAFLEPRGLINIGNMCYMNSVSSAVSVGCFTSSASKCFIRSCRSLFSVYHSTTFLKKSEGKPHIASKAIRLSWTPCKPVIGFPYSSILLT